MVSPPILPACLLSNEPSILLQLIGYRPLFHSSMEVFKAGLLSRDMEEYPTKFLKALEGIPAWGKICKESSYAPQ